MEVTTTNGRDEAVANPTPFVNSCTFSLALIWQPKDRLKFYWYLSKVFQLIVVFLANKRFPFLKKVLLSKEGLFCFLKNTSYKAYIKVFLPNISRISFCLFDEELNDGWNGSTAALRFDKPKSFKKCSSFFDYDTFVFFCSLFVD